MEFNDFKAQFVDQLLDVDASTISETSVIRQISSWDSMTAMAVVAMVEDNYNVKITDADWKGITTVNDLYELVKSRR
jgi:acyl carrier protein